MERRFAQSALKSFRNGRKYFVRFCSSTKTPETDESFSKDMKMQHEKAKVNEFILKTKMSVPSEFREIFPDFMPDADFTKRHPIAEKLERLDMMRRRELFEIPEFYVGSILAVTLADPFAPKKCTRFVGICILRDDRGLRHHITLRNVIDGLGVEVRYNVYSPMVQKIEVLKLEKRLDEHLLYLRDAPPEYSTIPVDMEAVPYLPNSPVPLNPIVVPLRPPPWTKYWEHYPELKGIGNFWHYLNDRRKSLFRNYHFESWRKYDIVDQYKKSIPREVQQNIFEEVVDFENKQLAGKTLGGRRSTFLAPLSRTKQQKIRSGSNEKRHK